MPLLSEPVRGLIRVAGPAGLKLVPLAGDGKRLNAVTVTYAGGNYTIEMPAGSGTHWFLLTDGE
jgi:hypothetical protein